MFDLSDRLTLLPVMHGSAAYALLVRERLLAGSYSTVAVPLPATWRETVLTAVSRLPAITAVVQESAEDETATYVPIDPCQAVIATLRSALQEKLAIEFYDWETPTFESVPHLLPDAQALQGLSAEALATAILPTLPRPPADGFTDQRVRRMAFELHRLELDHERVLALVDVVDWPWVREAYVERRPYPAARSFFAPLHKFAVRDRTLAFFLGELPFITALHERARRELGNDDNLTIDGVKELLLVARDRWSTQEKAARDWISPKVVQILLQYLRNWTLLHRRLSPDLFSLISAAKQVGGDAFALEVLATARDYPIEHPPVDWPTLDMGIGQGRLGEHGVMKLINRLPGTEVQWRACRLVPQPTKAESKRWSTMWDPHKQCSWPAEDLRIESFHTHVREQAKALLGADLARSEKFTTSVKDGLDMRETLRHAGEIHVRDVPPSRGSLEVVVFLFDVPADPEKYGWRTTWHAEHEAESTIGLFATNFRAEMVGPGIGKAQYGGVFFIFPPRFIPDWWTDPRLASYQQLELRLLAAACLHSQERHVAVVAPCPLKADWRRLAKSYGKKLIHMPMKRFSGRTIDRLRTVHVLNGKEIRSYAARFIRDA